MNERVAPALNAAIFATGINLEILPSRFNAQIKLAPETAADAVVWRDQARTLAGIEGYYGPGPGKAAFRTWASGLLAPVLQRVGFDARPGESSSEAVLRETLLLALSQIGDPTVSAEARRRFAAAASDLSRLAPTTTQRRRSADLPDVAEPRQGRQGPAGTQELSIDLAAVED